MHIKWACASVSKEQRNLQGPEPPVSYLQEPSSHHGGLGHCQVYVFSLLVIYGLILVQWEWCFEGRIKKYWLGKGWETPKILLRFSLPSLWQRLMLTLSNIAGELSMDLQEQMLKRKNIVMLIIFKMIYDILFIEIKTDSNSTVYFRKKFA